MEQDVFRLDVAVHHVVAVRVVQRIRDFAGQSHRIGDWKMGFAIQPVTKRFALRDRHHVIEVAVGFPGIIERKNVGMMQSGGETDFSQKASRSHSSGELLANDLERHLAVMPQIFREVHGGHPARAELALDAVPIGQSG